MAAHHPAHPDAPQPRTGSTRTDGTGRAGRAHRVRVVPGTEHVRVEIAGRLVAESVRPLLVYETGLPVRYYLPAQDVDLSLFEPTTTHTVCPYKGTASYWSYTGGGEVRPDVVWSYRDPIPAVAALKDHLSFYDTVADITVRRPPGPATG
ncbi:DUF427 domain-containing protein [Streptomyces pactum]|uniref:DUF427 domain-containing protein n=1 Tax=Streptomyces pactum TaxID=68249 RepID=UPI0037033223